MLDKNRFKSDLPPADQALPGRIAAMAISPEHFVNQNPMRIGYSEVAYSDSIMAFPFRSMRLTSYALS